MTVDELRASAANARIEPVCYGDEAGVWLHCMTCWRVDSIDPDKGSESNTMAPSFIDQLIAFAEKHAKCAR